MPTEGVEMVSKRLQEIPASGTIAISNLVSQMKSEGVDIVSFSMGEPDFTTPDNIIEACCDSLRSGYTHYTPSLGIPELRKAVADVSRKESGIPCDQSNVLITPCKQAIFLTALAYIDPETRSSSPIPHGSRTRPASVSPEESRSTSPHISRTSSSWTPRRSRRPLRPGPG